VDVSWRIQVEIDTLVLDDRMRGREIEARLERELAVDGAISEALGRDLPADEIHAAIARAVGRELGR
jgi:hypothetical protein